MNFDNAMHRRDELIVEIKALKDALGRNGIQGPFRVIVGKHKLDECELKDGQYFEGCIITVN